MKITPFLIVVVSCVSCLDSQTGIKQPADLLPRDTTVMILKELSIVESYVQNKYSHVAVFKELMKNSGNEILQKYHVNRVRFEKSFDYYASRQQLMRSIYSEVLDSLNVEASKIYEDELKDSNPRTVQRSNISVIPGIRTK